MYAVKPGMERINYTIYDGDTMYSSQMVADIANELIRRSDSYKAGEGWLEIDGGISYRLSDLERLVA